MPIIVSDLSDDQLANLVENHRRQGATEERLFLDALAELARRKGKGLDFDKSYSVITRAAKERRFVSYKELADASGADWARVRYSIGDHLWQLVAYAHGNGWPMLSSVVVNKQNIETGAMEPETLKGFVAAARELGHEVVDEQTFLREQQAAVFAWASRITSE